MTTHNSGDPRDPAKMYSIPLGMAGRACGLRTNSLRLAELAKEFFGTSADERPLCPQANLVLMARGRRLADLSSSAFPVFRGRGRYVHADYGRDGSIWFDLKAREVLGVFSYSLFADGEFFRRTVLAVIAGVLAPSLGVLALHAGCVVREGKGILLAAPSGTGKSTLALALAKRGWNLLSDEWTFAAAEPRGVCTWGMKTSLKLLPDAVRFFPELSRLAPEKALNGELSFEFEPQKVFGVSRALHAAPAAIVHLERNQARGSAQACEVTRWDAERTMTSLLSEIEQQPEEADDSGNFRAELMQQLCALPSIHVRFKGQPAAVAAEMDPILTELACA